MIVCYGVRAAGPLFLLPPHGPTSSGVGPFVLVLSDLTSSEQKKAVARVWTYGTLRAVKSPFRVDTVLWQT